MCTLHNGVKSFEHEFGIWYFLYTHIIENFKDFIEPKRIIFGPTWCLKTYTWSQVSKASPEIMMVFLTNLQDVLKNLQDSWLICKSNFKKMRWLTCVKNG